MDASGGPPRTSSVYAQHATSSIRPQSSLNSALSSASDAYSVDLPADSSEAENRQTGDEEETLKSSKHPRNKARKRRLGRQSVNGEIQRPSSPTTIMDYSAPDDDFFQGDVTESFAAGELEIIENALKNLQTQYRRQPVTNRERGSEELENPGQSLSSSNHLQDVDGVARLLRKVQAVRAQTTEAHSKQGRPRSGTIQGTRGREELNAADIRQVVQAASQAALAAAKAAQTVASLVNRNCEAVDNLCKTLGGSSSLQVPTKEDVEKTEGESSGNRILDIELQQTEISKKLVRQNRITHVVLGVIVVTTFIWRFVVVKFVKKVNNKVQNPFQGITELFDGVTGGPDEEGNKKECPGHQMFSQLVGDKSDDDAQQHNTHKPHDKDNVFSKLGSIMPGKDWGQKERSDDDALQRNTHKPQDKDNLFSKLGSIMPGQDRDRKKMR